MKELYFLLGVAYIWFIMQFLILPAHQKKKLIKKEKEDDRRRENEDKEIIKMAELMQEPAPADFVNNVILTNGDYIKQESINGFVDTTPSVRLIADFTYNKDVKIGDTFVVNSICYLANSEECTAELIKMRSSNDS